MNSLKIPHTLVVVILALIFLAGCGAPAATPTPAPTFPLPPPPTLQPPTQLVLPTQQASLFKLIQTVKVTADGTFEAGDFARIGYVPGSDHIVVAFGARFSQSQADCQDPYAYKEYTTEMVETGLSGILSCEARSDSGGLFTGDFYYLALAYTDRNGMDGWLLNKFNAVTWENLIATSYTLAEGEKGGDPMFSILNGQIDISSRYDSDLNLQPPGPFKSYATHHQFFSLDLEWVSDKLLSDVPHDNQAIPVAVDGTLNFVTATAMLGDLIVMQYDSNWNYLGMKLLKPKSSTPEGLAFDGQHFYVSYLDAPCADLPCGFNVHLAVFDRNWNILDDIAVTSFTDGDHKELRKPTLLLWNDRVYVAYVQIEDTSLPENQVPSTADMQVYVKVYELTRNP